MGGAAMDDIINCGDSYHLSDIMVPYGTSS